MLTYDVREPETPSDHRPLFIFGSPMGASGFEQLVSHFGDRTVITYDPRGMERSTREPDSELTAEVHADDYHTLVSHEPPLVALLEDHEMAIKVNADIVDTYQREGFGPAMAKFIQLVMHQGPLPDDDLDQPAPDLVVAP